MKKKTLKKIVKVMNKFNKFDNTLFSLLSEKAYDKYVSPLMEIIDDLCFLALYGEDYWTVHESFNAPGNDDGTKPVAWSNGFIPEKILDTLKGDRKTKDKVELIIDYINALNEAKEQFQSSKQ